MRRQAGLADAARKTAVGGGGRRVGETWRGQPVRCQSRQGEAVPGARAATGPRTPRQAVLGAVGWFPPRARFEAGGLSGKAKCVGLGGWPVRRADRKQWLC